MTQPPTPNDEKSSVLANPIWNGISAIVTIIAFLTGGSLGALINPFIDYFTIYPLVPIAIDSTKDWQSTTVSVNKGDTISIEVVSGKWSVARYPLTPEEKAKLSSNINGLEIFVYPAFETQGDGSSLFCPDYGLLNCPVPTAKLGTLVARIGLSTTFDIGNRKTFIAPDSGLLYLRINDGEKDGVKGLSDNSGVLAVEITVDKE